MKIAYAFDHAREIPPARRRSALGGKGTSLVDMVSLGLPVPPGFTIVTEACRQYLAVGWSDGIQKAIDEQLELLEQTSGRKLGDPVNPLIVSVRSGSPVSMPGMMDTVLNLGLNRETAQGLARRSSRSDFVRDCQALLVKSFRAATGSHSVPENPREQICQAVEAVFRSWNSPRARAYRNIERIADDTGTAVTIQAMVFGNADDRSATGVVFSRNPATGEPQLYGDVLFAAQGEEVVSGERHTREVSSLADQFPEILNELESAVRDIESFYRDLVEVEFTIESGSLWILQSRIGKRGPVAGIRIAVDMANDPRIGVSRAEAVERARPFLQRIPQKRSPGDNLTLLGRGLGASPGFVSGEVVTTSDAAAAKAASGKEVILVRPATSPADVEGIAVAAGLLTAKGGLASHAAVVARGWGKPAVVGMECLVAHDDHILVDGARVSVGDLISIDGETGEVFSGTASVEKQMPPEAEQVIIWIREAEQETSAANPQSKVLPGVGRDDLAILLSIKGLVLADALPELLGMDGEAANNHMSLLGDLVDRSSSAFLRLNSQGASLANDLMEAHRRDIGLDALSRVLEEFRDINSELKDLLARWQLQEFEGEADEAAHPQPAMAPLDDIRRIHDRLEAWLGASVVRQVAQNYVFRLRRALERASNNPNYLLSPRLDSYHNVWFELHELLIRLAGRRREEEEEEH